MKTKLLLLLALISSIFLVKAAAQEEKPEPPTKPKALSGGVLNGKATYLAKPTYPRAAFDARVGGATVVQVEIDEDGNVTAAKGVSGNPLLIKESEQAALQSKFSPTTLDGKRVRVIGLIVYNFVLPMPYFQIGYELALAQKSPVPAAIPLSSISGTLPAAWAEERAELTKLRNYGAEKPVAEKKEEPKKEETKPTSENNEGKFYSQGKALRSSPLKSEASSPSNAASDFTVDNQRAEAVEILIGVQTKLENRLSPNPQKLWYFRVGKVLGSLTAEVDNDAARRDNLAELEQLLGKTPFGVRPEFAGKFREIAAFAKVENFDAKAREKLLALLKELRESRVE